MLRSIITAGLIALSLGTAAPAFATPTPPPNPFNVFQNSINQTVATVNSQAGHVPNSVVISQAQASAKSAVTNLLHSLQH